LITAVAPIWWHVGGMKTAPVREKLTLRLTPTLHLRLRALADDNGRSLNGEIVQRLLRSLDESGAADQSCVVPASVAGHSV
jgi:hypothetical protein